MKSTFLLRLEPEIKRKLQEMAEEQRRSITSFILLLIDEKIREMENANRHLSL